MSGTQPADYAAAVERGGPLPPGPGDRFEGYAVLGVAFASGDVLALRRYPLSSTGAGYTSVWHRNADGRWTFYSDIAADQGCARYFARHVSKTIVAPIRIEWTGPRSLDVAVDGGRLLAWSLCLAPTISTRLLNVVSRMLPAGCWSSERALTTLGGVARLALRAGRLRLAGRTPSGNLFMTTLWRIWTIRASRATIGSRKLGRLERLPAQVSLGDLWIPRRPLFTAGAVVILPPLTDAPGYHPHASRLPPDLPLS